MAELVQKPPQGSSSNSKCQLLVTSISGYNHRKCLKTSKIILYAPQTKGILLKSFSGTKFQPETNRKSTGNECKSAISSLFIINTIKYHFLKCKQQQIRDRKLPEVSCKFSSWLLFSATELY